MTRIENLLRSWNCAAALENCYSFLNDNPAWTALQLYVELKLGFVYGANRCAIIPGAKGRLFVKAPAAGCCGASIYKPSFLH